MLELNPLLAALEQRHLALVTGGPGTGKTTLAARLVALSAMRLYARTNQLPVVALAAPTGKAAARLTEAFQSALSALTQEIEIPERLFVRLQQLQASTLHRLLGFSAHTDAFAHHQRAPLMVDLLLVDESSMISTHLMHALFCALDTLGGQREACEVILMGDGEQLEAVEIGAPFADLLRAAAQNDSALQGCALVLTKQWRAQPVLAELAASVRAIDSSDAETIDRTLQQFAPVMKVSNESGNAQKIIAQTINDGALDALFHADNVLVAWKAVNHYRVLCALHEGPDGRIALNHALESALRARFQISRTRFPVAYKGQLLMATRNDYALNVMNGDIGLVWPNEKGELAVHFEREHELISLLPSQLQELQPAFAMTVHKAQGSEFDRVSLVLPSVGGQSVLHRALVYTAITRARNQLEVIASQEVLTSALSTSMRRRSGFLSRLLKLD